MLINSQRLTTLACSAMVLSGCATAQQSRTAPPLSVNLSALQVCESILKPVAFPPATAQTNAKLAFVRDEAAIKIARYEIENGRRCVAQVRRSYAAPK